MELSLNLTTLAQIANFGIAFLLLKKLYFEPVTTMLLKEVEEIERFDTLLINQEALLVTEKKEAYLDLAKLKQELQENIPPLAWVSHTYPEEHQKIPTIEIGRKEMIDLFANVIIKRLEKEEKIEC